MTYFRGRDIYQKVGWADDPDELHRELHRVQGAFSTLDQNNFGTSGPAILQDLHLPHPTNPQGDGITGIAATGTGHGELSDPSQGPLAILQPGGSSATFVSVEKTVTSGTSGAWAALSDTSTSPEAPIEITVQSPAEAPYLVAAQLEVALDEYVDGSTGSYAVTEFLARVENRVVSSTGGSMIASGAAQLGGWARRGKPFNPACSILAVGTVILPAGRSSFKMLYRVTWSSQVFYTSSPHRPDVEILDARMFIVGLFR